MLIDTACSLAFYCQRCGRIQLQDVPLFSGQKQFVMECGNCGHEMGKITLRPRKGLELTTECGVCNGKNRQSFTWRQLKKLRFARLYCQHDNFELGYMGRWQDIAEFLDFNTAEYDALHPADGDCYIEHQQTLLEALNRIHDLAASGELECTCGSADIKAALQRDSVRLDCCYCGNYCELPARNAKDLQALKPGQGRKFNWRMRPWLDVKEK
ncbi:MAG: hypothetical protein E7201_08240 [Selenomonas ruminantium]|uniref:Uncharacterized protein n=1 Tax=Selenomonas ruminantium TaxID=971 RepID=A0A927WQ19_SELRU|nr:hypothetical protein [Selenomonas ruminantium]